MTVLIWKSKKLEELNIAGGNHTGVTYTLRKHRVREMSENVCCKNVFFKDGRLLGIKVYSK